jgi:hypothetical protein
VELVAGWWLLVAGRQLPVIRNPRQRASSNEQPASSNWLRKIGIIDLDQRFACLEQSDLLLVVVQI